MRQIDLACSALAVRCAAAKKEGKERKRVLSKSRVWII